MDLDYERLRAIYRLEKEASRLTRLEPDFYDLLARYIEGEKEKLREATEKLDIEAMKRFMNIKKLVQEFILLREKKIIRFALFSVLEGADEIENLVGWEKDMYREIRELIERYAKKVEAVFEGGGKREEREEKILNVVRVRILEDIPTFVGTDFKEYGPYRSGEEVDLPRDVADVLVRRGLAEVVG